ncbi:MAG: hypothetical protein ACYCTV_05820, partial [Leptospirales bacterium]
FHQQMDMISLTTEFQKRATPVRQDQAEGVMQTVEKFRSEGFSPVLCHKNDMQLERIDGLRA